jgi:hypothetical protein
MEGWRHECVRPGGVQRFGSSDGVQGAIASLHDGVTWLSYPDAPNRYEPASPRQARNLVVSHKTILAALEIMSRKGPIYPDGADRDASALVAGPPIERCIMYLVNRGALCI